MSFIPVNTPFLGAREEELVLECIRTGWISSEGPFVARFEQEMATRVGRKFGIAVANGTAALEIACRSLGLGQGDEVILPTFTIISCAQAITQCGATPVLVDADPLTWNMDLSQVEARITPRTRAIMAVHIYGLPVPMQSLEQLAEKYDLAIIEDAAEAIGLNCNGRACGSFGKISTFSFYPNKHVTTGEGGMVMTDDADVAERCRSLRNLCFQKERRFVHREIGWNYRLTNIQAALGIAQLERLDQTVERKRAIGRRYGEALSGMEGLRLPPDRIEEAENIYWVFGMVSEEPGPVADEWASRLQNRGIGTRPFFWPMHQQPVFLDAGLFGDECHPVAECIARRGFYIPSGLGMNDAEQQRVIEMVMEVHTTLRNEQL